MKSLKKITAIFLSALLLMVALVGCSNSGEKISPEESLKILIDVNIFGKSEQMDKVGIKQEAFDSLNKAKIIAFKESFLSTSKINKADIKEEQLNTFVNQVFSALGKAEITYGVANVNGKEATVDLNIRGLDFTTIVENTVKDVIASQVTNPNMTEAEYMQNFIEAYGKNIEKAPLVEVGKTVTVSMMENGNYYDVTNSSEIQDIMEALMIM